MFFDDEQRRRGNNPNEDNDNVNNANFINANDEDFDDDIQAGDGRRRAAADGGEQDPNVHDGNDVMMNRINNSSKPTHFLRIHYTPLSISVLFLLLWYTFRTRSGQFYPTILYLKSSKLAYVIIYNAIIALAISFFQFMSRFFLNGLRELERESIGEHLRWDMIETCLALTMFRDEVGVKMNMMFILLVLGKSLHWCLELRGKHYGQTEDLFYLIPKEERKSNGWFQSFPRMKMTHLKYFALGHLLYVLDLGAIIHCGTVSFEKGPSVHVLFGFEAAVLNVTALTCLWQFYMHMIDGLLNLLLQIDHEKKEQQELLCIQQQQQDNQNNGENGNNYSEATYPKTSRIDEIAVFWKERRGTYVLVIELFSQAAKLLCYLLFFAIVFTYYGMPINLFRELYVTYHELKRKISGFVSYYSLSRQIDVDFETVDFRLQKFNKKKNVHDDDDEVKDDKENAEENENEESEIDEQERICIICREIMIVGKKLPGCGHVFHAHCLKGWLMHQQSCPTCRSDITAAAARVKKAANENRQQQELEEDQIAEAQQETKEDDNAPDTHGNNEQNNAESRSDENATTAKTSTRATLRRPKKSTKSSAFPCLYRVSSDVGAIVYNSLSVPCDEIKRVIPKSMIVVCMEIKWHGGPSAELEEGVSDSSGNMMLKVPDGWVKERDLFRIAPIPVSM